jgi:hypothetical protein
MAEGGDAKYIIASLLEGNPDKSVITLPLVTPLDIDCCIELDVYGDVSDPSTFKNDRTGDSLWKFDKSTTAVDLWLQKWDESTGWGDVVQITNDTYGTYHAFGFFTSGSFDYAGVYMDWRKVLIDPDTLGTLGEGSYRIKAEETNILAALNGQKQYSFVYCVRNFSAERASDTIRFDIINTGILGDKNNPKEVFEFPPNWLDGMRLEGWFGGNNSTFEQSYVRYRSGKKVRLDDKQTEKYLLELGRFDEPIHKHIRTNILMATTVKITDYNTNNANEHINTEVKRDGAYEPVYHKQSRLYSVKIEFVSAYDNGRGLNC